MGKNSKLILLTVLICVLFFSPILAQVRHEINFPDIPEYKTLKCDLHMHTVFSDGQVWPTVRVDEAWREGLDAISITDHIEWTPHKEDIPVNHNRPYQIALPYAQEKNILLIMGAEITRETPPGHFNAIFLNDIEPLNTPEFLDVFKAAHQQGAFIFWNHPGWKPERQGWFDIHTTLYKNKWLHGIEVVNGNEYYPDAFQWCQDKNLTIMGNSDIHGPARYEHDPELKHRTITLVFARERTIPAIKEALFAGRTAIWYKNKLIGNRQYLEALFNAAVEAATPHLIKEKEVRFNLKNNFVIDIQLERTGNHGPAKITLPAHSTTTITTETEIPSDTIKLSYTAKNFLIAPEQGLPVEFMINLK
ncbi:MAG: hypothetical protein JW860_09170 [Sedimentisphaerales bacterium]|nr:hypothetical protein [Sedimentisphaerales bacterium]